MNYRLRLNGYRTCAVFARYGIFSPLDASILSGISYQMCARLWDHEVVHVNSPTVLKLKKLFGSPETRKLFDVPEVRTESTL